MNSSSNNVITANACSVTTRNRVDAKDFKVGHTRERVDTSESSNSSSANGGGSARKTNRTNNTN